MAFSKAIIDAAFVEGRDISDAVVVLQIAAEHGLEPGRFAELMASQRVEDDLAAALNFSAQVATGFPSLFLHDVAQDNLVHLGGADLRAPWPS